MKAAKAPTKPNKTARKRLPEKASSKTAASLAADLVTAERRLRATARALHDHAGSQLAAAGLQLQLLRLDHPAVGQIGADLAQNLAETMQNLRDLMMELDPEPVGSAGLHSVLLQLRERYRKTLSIAVNVVFRTQTPVSRVEAEDLCWLIARVVQTASQAGAKSINLEISGSRTVQVRIEIGEYAHMVSSVFEAVRYVTQAAGYNFDLQVGDATMITIHHAV